MNQTKTKPCKECPFKTSCAPGWLGPWTAEELHRFVMGENPFACHMTVKEDDEDTDEVELCVGSILYMNKNAKLCINPFLRAVQTKFKEDKTATDNILSSPEFVKKHTEIFKGKK